MQLIVLGMHRSGTTIVTRLLNLMGVYFGTEGTSTDKGFATQNPKGFWERSDVRELNDFILRAFDADWDLLSKFDWKKLDEKSRQEFEDQAKFVILNLDAHRPWVIKEPRLCLTFPLWRPMLEVPVVIHVIRNPLQVGQSLRSRDGFSIHAGIGLWERYNLAALEGSQGLPRLVVHHEDLFREPMKTLESLHAQLNQMSVHALRMPSEREVQRFLEPDLFRERGNLETLKEFANPKQLALYAALQSGEAMAWTAVPAMSQGGLEALRVHQEEFSALLDLRAMELGLIEKATLIRRSQVEPTPMEPGPRSKTEEAPRDPKVLEEEARQRRLEVRRRRRQNIRMVRRLLGQEKAFDKAMGRILKNLIKQIEVDEGSLEMINSLKTQLKRALEEYDVKKNDKKRVEALYNHKKAEYLAVKLAYDQVRSSALWKLGILIDKIRRLSGLHKLLHWYRSWKTAAYADVMHEEHLSAPQPPVIRSPESSGEKVADPFNDLNQVTVDVVVCVHNALADVTACLDSLFEGHPNFTLILVNDGSDEETTRFLKEFNEQTANCHLIENETAGGYTKAANQGLKVSTSDYVILLNSDTIAPKGWIEKLVACGESDRSIGIVGPLSNAASYQSVPRRFDEEGDWAINELPEGYDLKLFAALVNKLAPRSYPRVAFVNGFCFAIKRKVIEEIGFLDEEAFPFGYGEENDYCLRARKAGFQLAIAENAYVFHGKSKSYSHERRKKLSKAGSQALAGKHGKKTIQAGTQSLQTNLALQHMRAVIQKALTEDYIDLDRIQTAAPRIMFLLPVSGGGGGVHSILQETFGMRQMGFRAQVAIPRKSMDYFLSSYVNFGDCFFFYKDEPHLFREAKKNDVLVATIFTSVKLLHRIWLENSRILPAYYIQDYEPWFCDPGTPYEREALASYTLIPGILGFAKTRWLCKTVSDRHKIKVEKVVPSLDRSMYYFDPTAREVDGPVVISAMVRPKTERRSPELTMKVLRLLKIKYGKQIQVKIFGCENQDPLFLKLPRDFEFENKGILVREEVARLLRKSHIFLDLSTYQAFGRTGLEAMACGCVPLLPEKCGPDEYAIDQENAILLNTEDVPKIMANVDNLVKDKDHWRHLSQNAVAVGLNYSIRRSALSELGLFARYWQP